MNLNPRDLLLAGMLALSVLATAAVTPGLVGARPAYEIPVHETSDVESLSSADGGEWSEAPAATVDLASAGAAVPEADDVTVERATVQAARTDERLYLRLTWADATHDVDEGRVRAFADAVAVQLPTNTSSRPPIAMGRTSNPVNVWYWSAGNRTQELLAGGPGSTTPFESQRVESDAEYEEGRWNVVLSRPLDAAGSNRTTVPAERDLDVALAVWNGSNAERSGKKSVSEWYYLALGPGPEGPPYERILWAIAGLAIVGTTLVTIEGVRRTRGE